jgi:lysophospholipase L1-like esterase
MQAKNGPVGVGRRRGRLIGCVVALVALSAMVMPTLASAAKKAPPVTSTYLALGDSLAFGYSQQLYNEGQPKGDPAQGFENGYANAYLKKLKNKETQLTNDGCPGETTESLIGNNPELLGGLNAGLKAQFESEGGKPEEYIPVTGESPCAYGYAWTAFKTDGTGGPLHNEYGAGKSNFEVEPKPGEKVVAIPNVASQLENTIKEIKVDELTSKPVTSVTLDIGANDALHTLGGVETEVKALITGKVVKIATEELEKEIAERIGARVATEGKPECEAKFGEEVEKGEATPEEAEAKIGACIGKKVEQYEYEDYVSHHYEKEVETKAGEYAAAHQFELGAEGEALATEKIKEKIPALIAQMNKNIAGIMVALRHGESFGGSNYNGRITFLATYDPYGKQFHLAYEGDQFVEEHGGLGGPYAIDYGRCAVHAKTAAEEKTAIESGCEAAALHIGFNSIQALINNYSYQTVSAFGACDADALPTWNPSNPKKPLLEPERLKKWTNMTNGNTSNGKPDGPDIHPTPAGYKQLANEMYKEGTKTCHTQGLPGF